jgi:signal peptidase I
MRTSDLTTRMAGLAVVLLLAAAWYVFAPPQLGGSTSYAIVYGASMEPRFHRGDLVLLRSAAEYEVGDIAAYQSPQLGRSVMHRIVERAGDRYLFKGDNNDFLDSPKPARVDVTGKLWVRIPAAGRLLNALRTPALAALLAGLLALLLAGGGIERGVVRRHRRAAAPESSLGPPRRLPRIPLERGQVRRALRSLDRETANTALLACGAVGACCLLLALVAFSRPTTRSASTELYRQTGTFAYSATAPKGTVYPSGKLATGQTVFTRLVGRLAVRFEYRLRSEAPRSVWGTTTLVAKVRGDNGWARTLVLQPSKVFQGDRVSVRGTLDLAALNDLSKRVQKETETFSDSVALSLVPTITQGGTVGDQAVKARFAPALALRLNGNSLRLDTASPAGSEQTALVRSKRGYGQRSEPNELSLLGLRVEVATARALALLGGLGALAGAALLGWARTREREGGEPQQIEARYGAWLVEVAPRPRPDAAVLDVTTIEGLVRLAERYERMILHEVFGGTHSFLVEDDGVVYRYRPGTPGAEPRSVRAVKAAG